MSLMSEQEALYNLLKEKDYSIDTILLAVNSKQNIEVLQQVLREKDDEVEKYKFEYSRLYDYIKEMVDDLEEFMEV